MPDSIASIKARLLINRLNPRYPIDVEWFASQILNKPVTIHEVDLDNQCSAVIYDKTYYDYIHIGVNKNHPKRKQRFGCFHELAHIYLEHKGNISFIDGEEDPVLRKEADDFAAESLMPKHRILSLAANSKEPLWLVRQIFQLYTVSNEAASRRIFDLDIHRGAVMIFNHRRLFCNHKSNGFNYDIDVIDSILKYECSNLHCGKAIQKELHFYKTHIILHLYRFYSGNFLAFLIEAKDASVSFHYQHLNNFSNGLQLANR